MSEKTKEKKIFLKTTLSELYNGLPNETYGDRYVELKAKLLDDYKDIEKGDSVNYLMQKLLDQLDHEVLVNLHLKQKNPEVIHQAITNIKDAGYKTGSDSVYSNFAFMFPFN